MCVFVRMFAHLLAAVHACVVYVVVHRVVCLPVVLCRCVFACVFACVREVLVARLVACACCWCWLARARVSQCCRLRWTSTRWRAQVRRQLLVPAFQLWGPILELKNGLPFQRATVTNSSEQLYTIALNEQQLTTCAHRCICLCTRTLFAARVQCYIHGRSYARPMQGAIGASTWLGSRVAMLTPLPLCAE